MSRDYYGAETFRNKHIQFSFKDHFLHNIYSFTHSISYAFNKNWVLHHIIPVKDTSLHYQQCYCYGAITQVHGVGGVFAKCWQHHYSWC